MVKKAPVKGEMDSFSRINIMMHGMERSPQYLPLL